MNAQIFDLDFIQKALFNGAYPGREIQVWSPYSFQSVEVTPGKYSALPATDNIVYFGFLKSNTTDPVGIVVLTVPITISTPSTATPVFFDDMVVDGDGLLDTPVQFWGIRITVNAFAAISG